MPKHALRPDVTTSKDLSSGALSHTTAIGRKFKLESVSIHFSVAVTETVTITRDSINGANYDTVLSKRDLDSEQDFIYKPSGEDNFQEGDEVKVQCTAANLTGVAYVTIKTSELLKGA